jgi:hypothetical protein
MRSLSRSGQCWNLGGIFLVRYSIRCDRLDRWNRSARVGTRKGWSAASAEMKGVRAERRALPRVRAGRRGVARARVRHNRILQRIENLRAFAIVSSYSLRI